LKNINGKWRKTGGIGLPEGSNGIDTLKPETDWISGNHGIQTALEKDSAALYRSGTRHKAKSPVY
jgi:hypothetical protein